MVDARGSECSRRGNSTGDLLGRGDCGSGGGGEGGFREGGNG